MKKWICTLALLSICSLNVFADTDSSTEKMSEKIIDAINHAQVAVDAHGLKHLYGGVIDDEETNYGRWACARVASLILNQAGVNISKHLVAVADVEDSLHGWQKISDSRDIKAGDVVVFKHSSNSSGECSGGGSCHVAIAVNSWEVYGNVGFTIPHVIGPLGPETLPAELFAAVGYEFKEAFRAPNE